MMYRYISIVLPDDRSITYSVMEPSRGKDKHLIVPRHLAAVRHENVHEISKQVSSGQR